ncbi:MAG TPA: S-layer homology domain-containing protein [Acetivibrio sp.]|nr:S-layer homology domain-containing protein [Acetivibrio sp.]
MRKIFAFFLTVAIILNSILVVSFAATYKTITISPGQSWEFVNKTMTVAGISQKSSGKFDSAAYDASGSVSFVYYREEGSVYAAEGGRTVVTVPSSSRAIQFEYDSEKLTVRQASAPAVRAFTLNPGSNYEFTNSNSKDERLRQAGEQPVDFVEYGSDGSTDYISVGEDGVMFVPTKGRLAVSVPANSSAVTLYAANDHFNKYMTYQEVSEPAVYKLEMKPGETYEIKNNGAKDQYLRSKNKELYDYVMYKPNNSVYSSNIYYSGGEVIPAEYRLVLTLLPTANKDVFYMPYKEYKANSISITKSSDPAVYKVDVQPSESMAFTNTGSSDIVVYASLDDYYEAAVYKEDKSLYYAYESERGIQSLSPGQRIVVTVPNIMDMVTFYMAYDVYKNSLKIESSDEPALHKIVVLPGQSYEFKNIGQNNIRIYQSGQDKYKYESYSKSGSLLSSENSYSGNNSVFPGERLVVSVPSGSKAIAFYSGFEAYKNCIDPSIQPHIGFSISKQLEKAESKDEVLNVLTGSFALIPEDQKTSDKVKEFSVTFAEEAIKKISNEEISISDNEVEIDSSLVKKQVEKAKEALPDVEKVLEKSGIEKNRDIRPSIKINVKPEKEDALDLVIGKDLSKNVADIYSVDFSAGDVEISLETSGLEEELEEMNKLTISIDEEEQESAMSMQNIVLASSSTDIGPISAVAANSSSKVYKIDFKSGNGSKVDTLNNNVGLKIPAASDQGDYNCVYMVDSSGKTEAVGGLYNSDTKTLSVKTKKSGDYYVVENKKSFDDIKNKDATMIKAIEVMAAKGIINGRDNGKFEPDAPINRSEFATLIVRAIYKYNSNAKANFSDVEMKAWFYAFIASAKNEGIINGYPDNTFKPQNVINKQEIIAICSSVLNKEKGFYYPKDPDKFIDFADASSIPAWAKNAVAMANREGIIVKRRDGKFVGDQPFTRGDAAVILYRLFNKL